MLRNGRMKHPGSDLPPVYSVPCSSRQHHLHARPSYKFQGLFYAHEPVVASAGKPRTMTVYDEFTRLAETRLAHNILNYLNTIT